MIRASLARARVSLALLTERRVALFAIIHGFFLFVGLMMAFGGSSGSVREFWFPLFLLPALLIGVPMLSDMVAVERRSGTLDLALTSPGARFYFERRAATIAVLMILQGWLGIAMARAYGRGFAYSGPSIQVVITSLFLCAAVMNWSLRLKTAGAVMFATYVTAVAFAPWLFSNPIHPPTEMQGPMTAADIVDWTQQNLVLLSAAGVFYLYALQRLANPESIIQ